MNFTQLERFSQFSREITFPEHRPLSAKADEYLVGLRFGLTDRSIVLDAGRMFWRAQIGYDEFEDVNGTISVYAYRPERMKPNLEYSKVNRASPAGVPILYMATDPETAMSELRPWFGTDFTVAAFKTTRTLRIADCVHGESGTPLYVGGDDTPEYRSRAAWEFASDAFSRPVQREQESQYLVTQFLAETLRKEGFDGIKYKSVCTDKGQNLALFDLSSADVVSLHLYSVRSLGHTFSQSGPPERV